MNSFVTTCYTSMDNKKKPESSSTEDILHDLELLRQKMLKHASLDHGSAACNDKALAVFRIFRNMDLEQWKLVSDEPDFCNWLALPLQGSQFPTLMHIQERIEHLAHLTEHDALTGLANRRAIERNLETEIERATRLGSSLSVAMLDLDDFKKINDTYGHSCGDVVLQKFSQLIKEEIRKTDFAARFGGEEFILLLSGTSLLHAQQVLKRIKDKWEEMPVNCGHETLPVKLTCSMGLVCYKGKRKIDTETLIQASDQALYQAKEEGKNKIVTAPLADFIAEEQTLVGSEEKNFLFTK